MAGTHPLSEALKTAGDDIIDSRSVRSSKDNFIESACAMQLELLKLSLSLLRLTTTSRIGAVSADSPDSAGDALNYF
jgi:hypothetical protein